MIELIIALIGVIVLIAISYYLAASSQEKSENQVKDVWVDVDSWWRWVSPPKEE